MIDHFEQGFRDLLRRSDQAIPTGPDIGIGFQAVEFLFVFGNEDASGYDLLDFVVVAANRVTMGFENLLLMAIGLPVFENIVPQMSAQRVRRPRGFGLTGPMASDYTPRAARSSATCFGVTRGSYRASTSPPPLTRNLV